MTISAKASKIYQAAKAKAAATGEWAWRAEWAAAMKMAWRKIMNKAADVLDPAWSDRINNEIAANDNEASEDEALGEDYGLRKITKIETAMIREVIRLSIIRLDGDIYRMRAVCHQQYGAAKKSLGVSNADAPRDTVLYIVQDVLNKKIEENKCAQN